ncbi:triose-phosphate isomerase [Candidatus Nomurabacteria bacterium]|nr:triose-phosphate isomerase [Candidatus Nomurabacteria bacterium]
MKKNVPLIIGNWKLNPVTLSEAASLASGVVTKLKKETEALVVVAPSFIHLQEVKKKISKSLIELAAQDVYSKNIGAHTGEVSILQLKDLGVSMVIVGHSERRAMGETNKEVCQKVVTILAQKITPVVCVGESERDDQGNFFTFVEEQLRSLSEVLDTTQIKKVVIAYEPIWAIGTGNTATNEDVKEMQLFIETVLTKLYDRNTAKKVKLIYGGSVKAHNAAELYKEGGMSGFLVGGASLKAEEFSEIVKACK